MRQSLCSGAAELRAVRSDGMRQRRHYRMIDSDFEESRERAEARLLKERPYACPDCGEPNALTAAEKAKGYHCRRCTAAAEFGSE